MSTKGLNNVLVLQKMHGESEMFDLALSIGNSNCLRCECLATEFNSFRDRHT